MICLRKSNVGRSGMTNQLSFSHEQSCHTQNIFELYYTRSSSLFDCQWITRESTVHCIGWGLNKMECFIIKKMSTYASYAFLGEHTNELGLIIMLSGNRYLFFIIKSKKFHNNNFLLALGAIDKKTFITLRGLWSSPNPSRTKSNFTNICFTCSICFMFHLFLNGGICISYLCFFYEKP